MKEIVLVTGNDSKLKELQRLFPESISLRAEKIDLPELQTLDTQKLVIEKAKQAYRIIKKPIIVEDVSAGLACLNGLPGPFFKYFEQKLGREALYTLTSSSDDKRASVLCTMAYYDGNQLEVVEGKVKGIAVPARGEEGFGFDFVFVPDGYDKTFAELGAEIKNKISHRAIAVQTMCKQLGI